MTTQSALQYSFTFTQSHTHSYSASISSTLLFYEGNSGFSILPKDTSACRFGRLGIELPTFRLEDDHSTPQPQPPMWSPDWGVGDVSGGFEGGGDEGGAERCVLQEVVGGCCSEKQ